MGNGKALDTGGAGAAHENNCIGKADVTAGAADCMGAAGAGKLGGRSSYPGTMLMLPLLVAW